MLYASLGARLLLGGRPTVDELVEAIRTSPAPGIVVLPNDPQMRAVAEVAAQAVSRPVHVVPSRSLAQGLAALVAYRTDQAAPVLAAALEAAVAWARSADVTGGLDDTRGAPRRGGARARARLHARHGAGRGERGCAALTALAAWLTTAHPGVELELHDGGQAQPRYSVSAE